MKEGGSLSAAEPVLRLVGGARKRSVANLVLRQASLCAIAFLAAFITLLLLGTQVVHWAWPVVLGLAAAVLGWWSLAGKLPTGYDAARTIDQRLNLKDLVSTAWHFSSVEDAGRPKSRFLTQVAGDAAAAVSSVEPAAAMPLSWPREAWIAACLVAMAAVLMGVRYGVLHTLDLRAGLVDVKFDSFTGVPGPPVKKKGGPGSPDSMPPLTAMNVEEPARQNTQDDPFPEDALKSIDVADPNQKGSQVSQKTREGMTAGEEGDESGEAGEKSEPGDGKSGDDDQAPNSPPSKNADAKKQNGQPPNKDANSMLDKMRDAFNNMMDKLNMQPKGGEGEKAGSQSKQQSAKGQKGDEKGQQMASKTKGDPNSQSESDQPGNADDQAQGSNKSQSDQQEEPSNDPRSGMGRQDGKKDTDLAEQLDAMGKISEILGKRSANLSGEMMVEVQNSRQQLKTQYVNRKAAHGEAGGEVSRDEIPLHLQQYVQQYYEQVRKAAPADPAAPKPAAGR